MDNFINDPRASKIENLGSRLFVYPNICLSL